MESSRAVNHRAVVVLCIWTWTQLLGNSSHASFGPYPALIPVRCWGVSPPFPMYTHIPMELFSAPTAQTFGSAHYSFGRSMAQAVEGAGDNRSFDSCANTEMRYLGTASLQCTRRRHEMQSLIPWALCTLYKPTWLLISNDLTFKYWVVFAKGSQVPAWKTLLKHVFLHPMPTQPWNREGSDAVLGSLTLHSTQTKMLRRNRLFRFKK